jgi:hypothetical protein
MVLKGCMDHPELLAFGDLDGHPRTMPVTRSYLANYANGSTKSEAK